MTQVSTEAKFCVYISPSRTMVSTRMCQTATPANNASLLFGTKAVEERLASRIHDLLDVTVDANDGLPQHICGKYKRRVETLERSAEDFMQAV